jgi:hypothetical protein
MTALSVEEFGAALDELVGWARSTAHQSSTAEARARVLALYESACRVGESEIAALRMDVEKAEAQRDALRATVARVEALEREWRGSGDYKGGSLSGRDVAATLRAALSGEAQS